VGSGAGSVQQVVSRARRRGDEEAPTSQAAVCRWPHRSAPSRARTAPVTSVQALCGG